MHALMQDIRYGLRLLRKSPTFTVVAVLTLALGIGINTVIFSVINSVLLQSLPFRDPATLVKLSFDDSGVGLADMALSVPELEDVKTKAGVFQDVSGLGGGSCNLTGAKEPERLEFVIVNPTYFSMLGVKPEKGRLFGPQDSALGFAEGAIISDGLWRRGYGADQNIIGKHLQLDNDPYTIVGVLPSNFRHPGKTLATDADVWVSSEFSATPHPKPARNARIMSGAIARLKPGITVQEAQAKLDIMSEQIRRDFPSDYPSRSQWRVRIIPLQEALVGNVRPILLVLMGAVILVVLIASVNIANLLLARASGRQREMSMRLALGASRRRMVRQLLTESLVLSVLAGVIGVLTAEGVLLFVLRFVPFNIPRQNEISIDWVVLGFAALISLVTGLIFGLAPAIQSTKTDLLAAMREGARGSGYSSKTHRLRGLLIISEVAFTVVLMIAAGLLMRTFRGLLRENPGFNSERVVVSSIWLPVPNDPKTDPYNGIARQTQFARELLRRANAIPGVELAGFTSDLPGAPPQLRTDLTIQDMPSDSTQKLSAEVIRVSPDYFKIMQTPLMGGRFFSESDQADSQPVAVIDETTAQKFWQGRNPIGRQLKLGFWNTWLTVVGIIKDIKHDGLDVNATPHIYLSAYQRGGRALSLVFRTPLTPSVLAPQIEDAVHQIDPGLPVFGTRSMNEVMARSLATRRFSAELVGTFAMLALLLASVGIYGLLAYLVGQRAQEIGVRIALGAQRSDVIKMILGQGIMLAGAGVCVGLVLAAIASPMIAGLLYGINALDLVVFATVPLVLLIVSFLASYIPARRAAKVSPIAALREC
jgi:predicted permease